MNQDELLIGLRDQQRPRIENDTNWNSIGGPARRASGLAELFHEDQTTETATIGDENVLTDVARRQSSCHGYLPDVLPKYHFLKQLQREKRRTDRSKVPLSIALFQLGRKGDGGSRGVRELLEVLGSSKRETDAVGYLDGDVVAVLLPDTNEQGTQAFTERILSRAGKLPFSAVASTYPDQLFARLITESQEILLSHSLFLDDSTGRNECAYFMKRSLDIFGSIAAILLLWPVMLITAIAIAVTSPGPIIFKQVRLGRKGTPFVFYKFRSMFCNADDRIHREYVAKLIKGKLEEVNQGDAARPYYKIKSDPRVTRVGRFIRDTSIDELPQLFNVLKGDMSLVGPRPPVPYEAETYDSWHLRRVLEMKPGITGLWQVDGHSTTTFDEMVRIDLRYRRSCSLMVDLKILLRTVKIVLKCVATS